MLPSGHLLEKDRINAKSLSVQSLDSPIFLNKNDRFGYGSGW